MSMCKRREIEFIDMNRNNGDYIHFLDWLEKTGRNYSIRIHSANVVEMKNMRRIIEKNG